MTTRTFANSWLSARTGDTVTEGTLEIAAVAEAMRRADAEFQSDWRAGDRAWTWERHAAALLSRLIVAGWRVVPDEPEDVA